MLMTRCRAMQPKHNCALQASLLAHLYFVCTPPFLSSFPSRGFHSHSASLHAHDALSRYTAEAQLCFASQLARTLILRLHTAFPFINVNIKMYKSSKIIMYIFPNFQFLYDPSIYKIFRIS